MLLALRILGLALATTSTVALAASVTPAETPAQREARDRQVDRAALAAQDRAIAVLDRLIGKYRGTEQEAAFLERLADLHQQSAAIQFRLAHGMAKSSKVDLTRNHAELQATVKALDRLITVYPSYPELQKAWFMRGKAHEDLEEKPQAKRDYLEVSKKYAETDEAVPANMALANFAVEDNRHQEAIGYLKQVEKRPDSPHYPFALYKMAWSYYNLKDVPQSLRYLEKEVAYYRHSASERGGRLDSSENAILENALSDVATFYFEGTQADHATYGADAAFKYFRAMDSSPILGRMLARYAKLLRSRKDEPTLRQFKELCLQGEPQRPESLEVANLLYEYLLNDRRYKDLPAVAADFVRAHRAGGSALVASDAHKQSEKLLTDTATLLEKLALKNKGIAGSEFLSQSLVAIYAAFLDMVPGQDPRVYAVHFNLAETLFALDRYEDATAHYRWIVDRAAADSASLKPMEKAGLSLKTASLRALGSRYKSLKAAGTIPKDLAARATAGVSRQEPGAQLAEWLGWLDFHLKSWGYHDPSLDKFRFEATRAIYVLGRFDEALPLLLKAALERSSSDVAQGSAGLLMDTRIADQDWETLFNEAG
ncbi:MAG TPA: tetratricopeptide repeat protein, partial [Bdellovibrionota bacterium]|nr:tetratricopeptide repeat protein [Bdellovibrionota bacterium]